MPIWESLSPPHIYYFPCISAFPTPITSLFTQMSSPPSHSPEREWHTPQTARIKTLRDDASLSFGKIAQTISIPKSTVWDKYQTSTASQTSRRLGHHPNREESRGRPPKVTQKDIWNMEKILESDRIETRKMTWEQLGFEAELDVCGKTIKRAMGTLDYYKCIACRKG